MVREEATSGLAGFSCWSAILLELDLGEVGLLRERKIGILRENPSKKDWNRQQTQPGNGLSHTHLGV